MVLAGFAAFETWLFAVHGAIGPLLGVLNRPVLFLAVAGLTLASLLFHEFGHASACRYGGARPGVIGFGLYLIWPSLYTDVTDAYRLDRAGRLRTDLGGVYFNAIFILALSGGYAATGQPVFLAAAFLDNFQILQQLVPLVRMDGYFILGRPGRRSRPARPARPDHGQPAARGRRPAGRGPGPRPATGPARHGHRLGGGGHPPPGRGRRATHCGTCRRWRSPRHVRSLTV